MHSDHPFFLVLKISIIKWRIYVRNSPIWFFDFNNFEIMKFSLVLKFKVS